MKAVVPFLFATLLLVVSCDSPSSKVSIPPSSTSTNSTIGPRFDTPEHAVESLLSAYQSRDIEAVVAAKDFALDSRLFWEDLGLPVTDKQRTESVAAFESNFRKQMAEDGIPDYRGVEHSIAQREELQTNLVVITLDCRWSDGRKVRLRLPTLQTGSQWKAVLVPGYDHL
jgi:hypothetical protein